MNRRTDNTQAYMREHTQNFTTNDLRRLPTNFLQDRPTSASADSLRQPSETRLEAVQSLREQGYKTCPQALANADPDSSSESHVAFRFGYFFRRSTSVDSAEIPRAIQCSRYATSNLR